MARCGCSGAQCDQVRECISAGTGIDYNPDTGVISADPLDCTTVRACISAGDGIDYNPGTGVISAEPLDCAEVRACVSAADGVVFNSGTGVFSINAAPGCGMVGNGTLANPLRASVSAWPFACATTEGAGVYCDPGAGGVLRTDPPSRMAFFGQTFGVQEPPPGVLIPAAVTQVETYSVDVTNPDPCRPAFVFGARLLDMDFTLPAGASATAGMEGDVMWHVDNSGANQQDLIHYQTEKMFGGNIAAGATVTFNCDIFVSQGVGGARYNRIQSSISAWVISLPA